MQIISVEGIVVNTTPFKENSKILNILTKDKGIIGCVSKGCKSLKSKLRLVSEKYAYATFHLYYKENGLSTLIDGDIIDYFINIRSNIVSLSYVSYMCELSYNVYKQNDNNEIYCLLIDALMKIESNLNPKIICNILELQYLVYLGIDLNLDECVICGNSKVCTISLNKGGYICNKCRTSEPIIDEKVIKMLRLYYYIDINKIGELNIDENVSNKINEIIDEYYETYSGIYVKSKSFLKNVDK